MLQQYVKRIKTSFTIAVGQHMIKSFLFLIVCLFLNGNILSQECPYTIYSRLSDSARQSFKSQKFKEARNLFQQAFQQTDFPLGHDLSFALVVAVETDDHHFAKMVATQLAKGGIPKRYFSKYAKKKWFKEFSAEWPSHTKYFEEHFSREMHNQFIALIELDNNFNNQYHQWREGKIELSLVELIESAQRVVVGFEEFYQEFGFPLERKMGYNYDRTKNRIEPYPTHIVLIHIYQRGMRLFEENLVEIVCQGGLEPKYLPTIKKIQGFGDGTSIENEMTARYRKYRPDN